MVGSSGSRKDSSSCKSQFHSEYFSSARASKQDMDDFKESNRIFLFVLSSVQEMHSNQIHICFFLKFIYSELQIGKLKTTEFSM